MKLSLLPGCFVLLSSLVALTGCIYDDEPPRQLGPDPNQNAPSPAPSGSNAPAPPGNVGPMLVVVDADQTMDAKAGEGVGVFVEYKRGGHWHVWWTCDTTQTKQSCDFSVSASVAAGAISNLDAAELAGGFATAPSPARIDAKSTTTTEVHGIKFDTAAGAVLTVEASVGGLEDGAFLFFVQDGKVNGGFAGTLTNPLQLQGSAP